MSDVIRKKIIRITTAACSLVVFIISVKFWANFILNGIFINQYQQGIYNESLLKTIMLANLPEEYIAHYNLGGAYYNNNNMSAAKEEYLTALKTVPDYRICDVRLNLGLTMSNMLNPNSDNLKNELQEITKILLEDNCATEEGNGKHAGAQKLYDEIMKILEDNSTGGGSDTPGEDPDSEDPTTIDEPGMQVWSIQQAEGAQYNNNNNIFLQDSDYADYDEQNW